MEAFQELMGLLKALALEKHAHMVVVWPTFQSSMSSLNVATHSSGISACISVTADTSQLEMWPYVVVAFARLVHQRDKAVCRLLLLDSGASPAAGGCDEDTQRLGHSNVGAMRHEGRQA